MPGTSQSEQKPARRVCLGVAGGSGSGKSHLVRTLSGLLRNWSVATVHQDAYYRDQSSLAPSERARVNYDHPSAIEFDLLEEHIRALKNGLSVRSPVYDFATHTRRGYQDIAPGRLLIVEGILVLSVAEVRDLLDLSVFVDQDEDVRLSRRIERDTAERARTRESVIEQFRQTTLPMHAQFVHPSRTFADCVIRGDAGSDAEVAALAERLRSMMASDAKPAARSHSARSAE